MTTTELESRLSAVERDLAHLKVQMAQWEAGLEKIAIYGRADGMPAHSARQLVDGSWTSKIGRYKDIRHKSLGALESSLKGETDYGGVIHFMQRPRSRAG